jgi:CheY-like chemotaxis protein
MPKIIALSSSLDHKILNSVKSIVAATEKPIRRQQLLYLICRGAMQESKIEEMTGKEGGGLVSLPPAQRERADVSALKGLNVLIVEDNEVNRCVLRDLLSNFGMQSIEAVNGVEGLAAMERAGDTFDIVITDIHMPIMNGVDGTRLMRERGYTLPIVALTADVTDETRIKCENAGVTQFLLKPIRAAKLRDMLNGLFLGKDGKKNQSSANEEQKLTPAAATVVEKKKSGPRITKSSSSSALPADTRNQVLVCDDTETNLMFAEHILNKVNPGGGVTCVSSGQAAIDLLQKEEFCLVFMDIEMPQMNGIETTEKIREFNQTVPIIALTGHDDSQILAKCMAAGMIDVAHKPFKEAQLGGIVKKWFLNRVEEAKPAAIVAADQGSDAAAKAPASGVRNHILVCDDTETNLMFAEHILGKVNPKGGLTCVSSGQAAIDLLKKEEFSLVFMDIEMPQMNGIETTQKIREFNQMMPIVALTGHDDPKILAQCRDAGMVDVAHKPFKEAQLGAIVKKYML